jgi:hypothetical protein
LYIAGSGKYFKVAVTKLAIHSGPPPPRAGLSGDAAGVSQKPSPAKLSLKGGRAGLGSHGTSVPVSVNAISGYWLGP